MSSPKTVNASSLTWGGALAGGSYVALAVNNDIGPQQLTINVGSVVGSGDADTVLQHDSCFIVLFTSLALYTHTVILISSPPLRTHTHTHTHTHTPNAAITCTKSYLIIKRIQLCSLASDVHCARVVVEQDTARHGDALVNVDFPCGRSTRLRDDSPHPHC